MGLRPEAFVASHSRGHGRRDCHRGSGRVQPLGEAPCGLASRASWPMVPHWEAPRHEHLTLKCRVAADQNAWGLRLSRETAGCEVRPPSPLERRAARTVTPGAQLAGLTHRLRWIFASHLAGLRVDIRLAIGEASPVSTSCTSSQVKDRETCSLSSSFANCGPSRNWTKPRLAASYSTRRLKGVEPTRERRS